MIQNLLENSIVTPIKIAIKILIAKMGKNETKRDESITSAVTPNPVNTIISIYRSIITEITPIWIPIRSLISTARVRSPIRPGVKSE